MLDNGDQRLIRARAHIEPKNVQMNGNFTAAPIRARAVLPTRAWILWFGLSLLLWLLVPQGPRAAPDLRPAAALQAPCHASIKNVSN